MFHIFLRKFVTKIYGIEIRVTVHWAITESKQDKSMEYHPSCGGRTFCSTENHMIRHNYLTLSAYCSILYKLAELGGKKNYKINK